MLYYTKVTPEAVAPVFNYSTLGTPPHEANRFYRLTSPEYCLRAKCLKQRKRSGDDNKVELTDIWSDIHRIKHKRDRDAHPCQLPEKLMERIILAMTTPNVVDWYLIRFAWRWHDCDCSSKNWAETLL